MQAGHRPDAPGAAAFCRDDGVRKRPGRRDGGRQAARLGRLRPLPWGSRAVRASAPGEPQSRKPWAFAAQAAGARTGPRGRAFCASAGRDRRRSDRRGDDLADRDRGQPPRAGHRRPLDRAHRPRPAAGGDAPGLHGRGPHNRGGRAGDRGLAGRGHRRLPGAECVSLLSVQDLDCRYGLLQAVRGVTFEMKAGEIVGLIGANGAGKTTLLRTIAGAHTPHGGRVMLDGEDITGKPAHRRVAMGIALVPEGRRLFPSLTVEENLRVASTRRRGRWTVQTVLELFPLLQPRRRPAAANLSGGEQQAVAIGRALMSNPRVLLLDEVSLGLAPVVVDALYASLQSVIGEGATAVLVEQDLTRALKV